MIYDVIVEPSAKEDIRSIVTYIRTAFHYDLFAMELFEALHHAIFLLNRNPRRYRKYGEGSYAEREVHVMPVRNYNVYYAVDDNAEEVHVLRVIYSGRDQASALLK